MGKRSADHVTPPAGTLQTGDRTVVPLPYAERGLGLVAVVVSLLITGFVCMAYGAAVESTMLFRGGVALQVAAVLPTFFDAPAQITITPTRLRIRQRYSTGVDLFLGEVASCRPVVRTRETYDKQGNPRQHRDVALEFVLGDGRRVATRAFPGERMADVQWVAQEIRKRLSPERAGSATDVPDALVAARAAGHAQRE